MLSERVDFARLEELARKGVGQAFRVPAANLERLSACIYQADTGQENAEPAVLEGNVQFDVGPGGLPRIGLLVKGRLRLECQRCLEPVVWLVRIETRLSVLESDGQTELLENPFDSVLVSADGLQLAAVIEDEVLAALPMVPVHRDGPNCRPAGGEDSDLTMDPELMHKPFADLASLVGRRKSDTDS